MGIFQTVLVQIALQVRVKIAQFAAVKHIISTDFAALFVLQIFLDRNKQKCKCGWPPSSSWTMAHDIFLSHSDLP